jgi:transglutaminase-like putative cysteine protease
MIMSLVLRTRYHYDFPVFLERHLFRLRPRYNSAQRLLPFDTGITPEPAGITECLDYDGNLALNAWFQANTSQLALGSRFTVPLCTALNAYRDDTHVAELVKQYARSAADAAKWNTLPFFSKLWTQIHQTFRHVIRPDAAAWASNQTLRMFEGPCRDLAILYCDLCRVRGIAARFVSGYECASATAQEQYLHAWAEVYLPDVGWRGYDPARGLAVSTASVAVASGYFYQRASPVAGSYSGGSQSQMLTALSMQVDDAK